jgi:hypothetical protein
MGLGQFLHQPAEGAFAVGIAHRAEGTVQARRKALQVTVVGQHPVAAPQLAHERVGVFQRHAALGGLADVRNHVLALDGVALDEFGHRAGARTVVVDEVAQATAFEEADAEAVLVLVRAVGQARKAEHHVGRRVGIHAQQLAHHGTPIRRTAATCRAS